MDVWLKIFRVDGNTYRVGDVVQVYPMESDPPDMTTVRSNGRNLYSAIGLRNLPAKIETLEQARKLFLRPWEDVPEDPQSELEPNPDRRRRKFHIDINRLPGPRKAALFDAPPFNLKVTWAQIQASMRNVKEDAPIRDDDIPERRVARRSTR